MTLSHEPILESIDKLANPLSLKLDDISVILERLVAYCGEGKEARNFLTSNCCVKNTLIIIAVSKSIDVKRKASYLLILLSESTEYVDFSEIDENEIPDEICSIVSKSDLILDFKLFIDFIFGIKFILKNVSSESMFGEIGKSPIFLSIPCCNQILQRAIGFLSYSSSDVDHLPYSSSEILMMQCNVVTSLMWLMRTGIMNRAFKSDNFLVIFSNFTKCLEDILRKPKSEITFGVSFLLSKINEGGIPPCPPAVHQSLSQREAKTQKRTRRQKHPPRGRSPGTVDAEFEANEFVNDKMVGRGEVI